MMMIPTHVVIGKGPAICYQDPDFSNGAAGTCLRPGTKVVASAVDAAGLAMQLEGTVGSPGLWISASRLKALPAQPLAQQCAACKQNLPSSAFSKASRRRLRAGQSAICEACAAPKAARGRWFKSECSLHEVCCHVVSLRLRKLFTWEYISCSVSGLTLAVAISLGAVHLQVHGYFAALATLGFGVVFALSMACSTLAKSNQPRPEPCIEKIGLRLVADDSSLAWKRCVYDLWGRSFASYLPNPFCESDLASWWLAALHGTPWQQPEVRGGGILPRQAAWFVRDGCSCAYEYNGTLWPPVAMPPWLLAIEHAVWDVLGIGASESFEPPNTCVANFYADGLQAVDWHADNEPLFDGLHQDCRIISLSLGTVRKFELRPRRVRRQGPGDLERVCVELGNGDLVTMEGRFQKHWEHRVPREGNVKGPRINFTWRTIQCHIKNCPMHK